MVGLLKKIDNYPCSKLAMVRYLHNLEDAKCCVAFYLSNG